MGWKNIIYVYMERNVCADKLKKFRFWNHNFH